MGVKSLLASFVQSRGAYDTVADAIVESDLAETEKLVLSHIHRYYERDPDAKRCDPELLTNAVCREIQNPKHKEMFAGIVHDLATMEVSPANVTHDFIEVRRDAVGNALASALLAGKGYEEVSPLVDELSEWLVRTNLEQEEREVAQGKTVLQLVEERTKQGGLIKVAPGSLNARLGGGLLRGHHLILFARPEVGKTMFLVNCIAGFLHQNLKVLYVGNEDPIDDIMLRVVSRLALMDRAAIIDDVQAAQAAAEERGYNNVVFAGLSPGTPRQIEKLVEEHKPDVILVDQLRNLNVGEDNFTRALEKSAVAVRNIGKRHKALAISVTQAGDSASGKAVLDMGDVDNSNTGIPAQADVLIGLGMGPEDEARGFRVVSLCKNKPGANHDFFTVAVDPSRSHIRSME